MKKNFLLMLGVLSMLMAGYRVCAQEIRNRNEVTVRLDPGWTWVGYPRCDTMGTAEMLHSIQPSDMDVIKSQTNAALFMDGTWYGGMQRLTPGKGLKYKSNNPEVVTFVMTSNTSSPVEISLDPGWTWLSYPLADTMDVTEALRSIQPVSGDLIKSQYSSALYMNGYWYGSLQKLVPGMGLMYKSNRPHIVSFVFGVHTVPAVITSMATFITDSTATVGGEVTNDGGEIVTERGICWSQSQNPTLDDNHIACGEGTGSFTTEIADLTANTTYYVRAYAVNSEGVGYGNEVSFTTLDIPITPPEGAIAGMFSVSDSTKVFFSKGNLQYQASTNTWRFAENQYDFVGLSNNNISETNPNWIDLFAWGTSGYNHGAVSFMPWSTSISETHYKAYGNANYDLSDQTRQADWGYNAISNGGNAENLWRTLTDEEWDYLLNNRTTPSGQRFAKATVEGVKGLILLPDHWNSATYPLDATNNGRMVMFNTNEISASDWMILEDAGAVFLPAAGSRFDKTVSGYSDPNSQYASGYYWTPIHDNTDGACVFHFIKSGLMPLYTHYRFIGLSVRVVCPVE